MQAIGRRVAPGAATSTTGRSATTPAPPTARRWACPSRPAPSSPEASASTPPPSAPPPAAIRGARGRAAVRQRGPARARESAAPPGRGVRPRARAGARRPAGHRRRGRARPACGPARHRAHGPGRRGDAARVPVRRPGAGGGGRRVRLQLGVRGLARRGRRGDGARARPWPPSPSRRWPSSRTGTSAPGSRPRRRLRPGRRHAGRLAGARPEGAVGRHAAVGGRHVLARRRRRPARRPARRARGRDSTGTPARRSCSDETAGRPSGSAGGRASCRSTPSLPGARPTAGTARPGATTSPPSATSSTGCSTCWPATTSRPRGPWSATSSSTPAMTTAGPAPRAGHARLRLARRRLAGRRPGHDPGRRPLLVRARHRRRHPGLPGAPGGGQSLVLARDRRRPGVHARGVRLGAGRPPPRWPPQRQISLRSFVYPRNKVAQVARLADHGFRCYRGGRPAPPFAGRPAWQRRALGLADKLRPLAGSAVLPARRRRRRVERAADLPVRPCLGAPAPGRAVGPPADRPPASGGTPPVAVPPVVPPVQRHGRPRPGLRRPRTHLRGGGPPARRGRLDMLTMGDVAARSTPTSDARATRGPAEQGGPGRVRSA